MTSHPGSPRIRRAATTLGGRRFRLATGLAAAAACVVAAGAPAASAPAGPSERAGLVWTVKWKAPTTSAGPNRFDRPASMAGTAAYALGPISRVDYRATSPSGLPAACGTSPATGPASLSGGAFTIKPALRCNGTYAISVVAQSGSGVLAAKSPALEAPLTLADPGPAPSGFGGVVQGSTRSVTLSWATDTDPDVIGYRVRRNGTAIADVPANVRIHTDIVPSTGSFRYDLLTLRWGGGGPGSAAITSPATAPLVAEVRADAPAVPIAPSGGSGSGSGGGGGAGTAGGGSSGGGTGSAHGSAASAKPPAAGKATAGLPSAGKASAKVGSRSGYRSGGSISPNGSVTGTTIDDGFLDKLPYEPGTSREKVELAGPDRTEAVRTSVSVPGRSRPGLLVPLAVVLVLVAASLQVRSLLGRAGALRSEQPDPLTS